MNVSINFDMNNSTWLRCSWSQVMVRDIKEGMSQWLYDGM